MARKALAIVDYPGHPKVVASVSTTKSKVVLALGDGSEEHYTYPLDGRFHITTHETPSVRSFFAPGPPLLEAEWHRIASIAVPEDHEQLKRDFKASSHESVTLPPPTGHEGILEVGILGKRATPEILQALRGPGLIVGTFQGPTSGSTVAFRYHP